MSVMDSFRSGDMHDQDLDYNVPNQNNVPYERNRRPNNYRQGYRGSFDDSYIGHQPNVPRRQRYEYNQSGYNNRNYTGGYNSNMYPNNYNNRGAYSNYNNYSGSNLDYANRNGYSRMRGHNGMRSYNAPNILGPIIGIVAMGILAIFIATEYPFLFGVICVLTLMVIVSRVRGTSHNSRGIMSDRNLNRSNHNRRNRNYMGQDDNTMNY